MNTLEEALKELEKSNEIIATYANKILELTSALRKYEAFRKSMPKKRNYNHPMEFFDEEDKIISHAKTDGWNDCVSTIDDSSLWVK